MKHIIKKRKKLKVIAVRKSLEITSRKTPAGAREPGRAGAGRAGAGRAGVGREGSGRAGAGRAGAGPGWAKGNN